MITMREKSQVFDTFLKWQALVENESGCKVKCLKSDNGGEYCDARFEEYCASHGIRRIKTVPNTPQQNGVAERLNRTVLERARCMRLHAGLPLSMWGAAVDTATYLINRSPSSAIEGRIPQEQWSGKSVDYSFLKVFGCIAYMLVGKEKRDKLSPKSQKCAFVGYGGDDYGYRLWDYEHNKIIRSRDVVFNEKCMYKQREDVGSSEKDDREYISPEDHDVQGLESIQPQEEPVEVQEPVQIPIVPDLRRSSRQRREPVRLNLLCEGQVLYTDSGEPECYQEAVRNGASIKWEKAMQEEMSSLEINNTWDLVRKPEDKRVLQNKWVYRIKHEVGGSKRYKARLVVKGFRQKQGIDYNEIFSPVVKMTSIRVILSLVAVQDMFLEQLDVKTAFLHGDLEEEIYMSQPEGFEVKDKERMVCRLKRSLYGLKQAPRQWYLKFDQFMQKNNFKRCQSDHCVYVQRYANGDICILTLYVDDMLVAGTSMQRIVDLKKKLASAFEMKDLGEAKKLLGMEIRRDRQKKKLWLSQVDYVEKVLERFSMQDAKTVTVPMPSHFKLSKEQCASSEEERKYMDGVPYASAIGSLMYAMVCTRPDIAQAVGVTSRFLQNPGRQHWEAVKWILRYLKGTSKHCLCFGGDNMELKGFVDSDHAGDRDGSKSTTGYVYTVGGTAVSWISKLQKVVALSTTEAEYIAVTEASKEMIWLQRLLGELGIKGVGGKLCSDSQSAIHLAKNGAFHSKTKHIKLRYHFIRKLLEDGELILEKIDGSKNPADKFTKPVTAVKLELCKASVGLHG